MKANLTFSTIAVLSLLTLGSIQAQTLDLAIPQDYRIAGLTVMGAEYTDVQAIKLFTGLKVGEEIRIPGDRIARAIHNLWDQRLFDDVSVEVAERREQDVYLVVRVLEIPRLSHYGFDGVKRSEQETLRDKLDIVRGQVVNNHLRATTRRILLDHYYEKGYFDAEIAIKVIPDSILDNAASVHIDIHKGEKIKIGELSIIGAVELKEKVLLRKMKNTKEQTFLRIFKPSKYLASDFQDDLDAVIAYYNTEGFRNARIAGDSLYRTPEGELGIAVTVNEGHRFYFREISFTGNTKYRTTQLDSILGIKRGDIYNVAELEQRIFMNPKGMDLSALYSDDGYLTFRAMPVEIRAEGDSIDLEIRLMEGKQFRIGQVTIRGNTKTNDNVALREVRTQPGELFSRTDVIRTQRELSQLNYFNPEAFQINPVQNPEEGTVDIEYVVEEKPTDQIELQGGWGGGRIVGSLGVTFNNFALKKVFERDTWRPVPMGDGQRISIRAQSNGLYFQSYNLSFTEPWLGGKKPNGLTVGMWRSIQSNGLPKKIEGEPNPDRQTLMISGVSASLGQRWKRPDDWFVMSLGLAYQRFDFDDYNSGLFSFTDGRSNNIALTFNLSRNSVSDPIFPVWGSEIRFSVKATPPYSAFQPDRDWSGATDQEKFRFVEYHKWKFAANWYTPLTTSGGENPRSLVLHTYFGAGLIGLYNAQLGLSPFERFYLGGVFLSGYVLDGREIISLRGYDNLSLTEPDQNTGAPAITKYGFELRYPLSTNPSATIYTMAFMEAGRTWENAERFNPFDAYRSAGVGMRIFLPMFGLLGLDYGWRLDDVPAAPSMSQGQFHFSMGMNIGDL
ncbi:MAG: outer membrane protein assembly factor BamA [Flavobacteriales bacterium]|nr:outer membrane protein assembly factor BamA [Flavobacteriales bacterium]